MIEEIKNIKREKSDLKNFGITVGTVLLVITGFFFWKEKESFQLLLTISIFLFVLGIAAPLILKPVYVVWMVFATILGWVMTRVILTLLFYVVCTPIGLILRLSGKQLLEIIWDDSTDSYWNYRTKKELKSEDYERQF